MAQLAEHPTSAQVMISCFVGLSPTSGSLLSVRTPLQILCSPLCPLLTLFQKLINILKNNKSYIEVQSNKNSQDLFEEQLKRRTYFPEYKHTVEGCLGGSVS